MEWMVPVTPGTRTAGGVTGDTNFESISLGQRLPPKLQHLKDHCNRRCS